MTADALADVDDAPVGFQMQSHSKGADGIRAWVPMEDGPAANVWRPRRTAEDAVHKCLEWTGLVCIPAMRVVDLSSGAVLWQDRWAGGSAGELEAIVPAWAAPIYDRVRAEFAAECERDRALLEDRPVSAPAPAPVVVDDGALFNMGEFDV